MSLGCFRPALHVSPDGRVDMDGSWGGTLGTVLPAPGAARTTVMDWWLQVFFVSHSGRTGANSCWDNGSSTCAGSFSDPSFAAGFIAPSTASPDDVICLEGDDELRVHHCELRHESHVNSCELCNGNAVTRRNRC